jgi:hypothetical protein
MADVEPNGVAASGTKKYSECPLPFVGACANNAMELR